MRNCIGAAIAMMMLACGAASAAGPYAFDKDVDYSKVLFSIDKAKSLTKIKDMSKVAQRNKVVADTVRVMQQSFHPSLEFNEAKGIGSAILKEAKEKKAGFALMVTIKTLEGHIEQELHLFSRGVWRRLYKAKTPPLKDLGICRHPMEVPFYQAMLPLHVVMYSKKSARDKYEDGSSLMVKKYKVDYSVKNHLPFKVATLSLCYLHVGAKKGDPVFYRVIARDVKVPMEPGGTGAFTLEEKKFPHSEEFDNAKKAMVYGASPEEKKPEPEMMVP
ncbi:hypothetical protein ACFL01_00315 [Planctomycetota bacterium]